MKSIILITLLVFSFSSQKPISGDCKCNGINLWGDVEIVSIGEDFRVKVVLIDADLKVDTIPSLPSKCGEWRFVECLGDFKIRFVDIDEDFSIQFSSLPGLP